jgi:hypothetical protein
VTAHLYKKGPHFKTYGKRFGTCARAGGYIANIYDQGPGPDHARISKHCNLNKMQTIYIIRNTCGCVGWVALPKSLPLALEVAASSPADYQSFKPLSRGHMPAIDWATCFHSIRHKQATCHTPIRRPSANQHLPCVVWPCQLIPTTCRMDLPRQHPYGLYS